MTTLSTTPDPTAPVHLVMPADLAAAPLADAYARRMVEALRAAGAGIMLHALPGPHPRVDPSAILAADVALSRLPDGAPVLLDGNALPNLAASLPADSRRLRFTALIERLHWTEPGLAAEEAAVRRNLEQGALALMRHVAVPDETVAATLRDLGVRPERIVIAAADADGAAALLAVL